MALLNRCLAQCAAAGCRLRSGCLASSPSGCITAHMLPYRDGWTLCAIPYTALHISQSPSGFSHSPGWRSSKSLTGKVQNLIRHCVKPCIEEQTRKITRRNAVAPPSLASVPESAGPQQHGSGKTSIKLLVSMRHAPGRMRRARRAGRRRCAGGGRRDFRGAFECRRGRGGKRDLVASATRLQVSIRSQGAHHPLLPPPPGGARRASAEAGARGRHRQLARPAAAAVAPGITWPAQAESLLISTPKLSLVDEV